jgi:hypothetical protein
MVGLVRLRTAIQRLGADILITSYNLDRKALGVAVLAITFGLITYVAIPSDSARLNRFAIEHVQLFGIEDSTPLRCSFLTYFITLLTGAFILCRARPVTPMTSAATHTLEFIGSGAIALVLVTLGYSAKAAMPQGGEARWLPALYLVYTASIAAFVWHRKLPRPAVPVSIVLILVGALWPTAIGSMSRVSLPLLPWVDQHLSALFSGGQMLEFGYRLFRDVPTGYGTLTPLALAATIRTGVDVDIAFLLHLVEVFQVLTLCLFILATFTLTREAEGGARAAAVLLVVLVASPFLSFGNMAVLLPNQSGFRFIMFPIAVLTITIVQRRPIVASAILSGAVATLAVLYNLETGIAIVAGLALAWLLRASDEPPYEIAFAVASGLVAAASVVCLVLVAHRLLFGIWPVANFNGGTSTLQNFGAGFGGLRPPLRIVVVVIFGHCGYVLARAIAQLFGRKGDQIDVASAGISAMLVTWAPYYANRPADWNSWTYLVLYALLLAPIIVKNCTRSGWLAVISLLLLFPIPLTMARNDIATRIEAAAMRVDEHCVAGLSITPAACVDHRARAAELARLAGPGDVLWITAYPFLTLQLTKLRPLVAPLDLYAAALDETDLNGVAERIRLARPIALLLDGTNPSPANDAIPAPIRSLLLRIALATGYEQCPLVKLSRWQLWLPRQECTDTSAPVRTLQTRMARR